MCAFASVSILGLVFVCSGAARGRGGVWGHSCTHLCADAISHPGRGAQLRGTSSPGSGAAVGA